MKKLTKIIWGVALVAVGVIFALNACGFTDINVFFRGWWTLFIIVPCTVGIFSERDKTGNIFGLVLGVLLLLACQDILTFGLIWKLAVAAFVILAGLKIIFGGIFGNRSTEIIKKFKENGTEIRNGTATFSGQNLNFDGEIFNGAELNAIFGGIKCDLTRAIIDKDCVINASAVFGGIEIYIPDNINVKINSTSIFGGVSEKKRNSFTDNAFTLYINATCMFGGVEIK